MQTHKITDSDTLGAVVRLHRLHDFPNSFNLTGVRLFLDTDPAPDGCAYPHGACLTAQRMGNGS
jgi:hypothetical protein